MLRVVPEQQHSLHWEKKLTKGCVEVSMCCLPRELHGGAGGGGSLFSACVEWGVAFQTQWMNGEKSLWGRGRSSLPARPHRDFTMAKSHSGGMGLVLVSQGCQESHPTALGPRQRERDPAAVGFSGLGCSHVLQASWQMQCLYKATNDFLKEWSLDNGVLLCSLPKQGGCVTLIFSGCGLL